MKLLENNFPQKILRACGGKIVHFICNDAFEIVSSNEIFFQEEFLSIISGIIGFKKIFREYHRVTYEGDYEFLQGPAINQVTKH